MSVETQLQELQEIVKKQTEIIIMLINSLQENASQGLPANVNRVDLRLERIQSLASELNRLVMELPL